MAGNVIQAFKLIAISVLSGIAAILFLIFLSKPLSWILFSVFVLIGLALFIGAGMAILLPMLGLSGGDEEDVKEFNSSR